MSPFRNKGKGESIQLYMKDDPMQKENWTESLRGDGGKMRSFRKPGIPKF